MISVYAHILHPQSSRGKFVYEYKTERGDVYYTENGKIKYFDTPEEAKETCGSRPCWSVSEIINPMGDKIMWKCINDIKALNQILFKAGNVYEEGDDRGDCEKPEDMAICLFDETGNRSYLYNAQIYDNFVEIELTKEEMEIVEIIKKGMQLTGRDNMNKAISYFVEMCKQAKLNN